MRFALGALFLVALAACGGGGGGGSGGSGPGDPSIADPDPSTDATLASLGVSAGTLSPSFSPATTTYSVDIGPLASSASLTPVASDAGAAVRVDGVLVASGTSSSPAPLAPGIPRPFDVEVRAEDGTTVLHYAVVLTRSADPFDDEGYLKAGNPGAQDAFGYSVAVSGVTLVVGAQGESGSGTGVDPPVDEFAAFAGAVYVFGRSAGTWTQQAYLKASNTGASDAFGYSVAVSGDTIVVGAPNESGNGTGVDPLDNDDAQLAGAAYVFVRSAGAWTQQAYLKPSNTGTGDLFGSSVALSGDTVVVGAPLESGSGTGVNPASNELAFESGAAYVFVRNAGAWTQQAYLKASNTGAGDRFGLSVGMSGDTAVVGAWLEAGSGAGVNPPDDNGLGAAGAAYVFVRSSGTWMQQAYLKASNPNLGDSFGFAVAVAGDTVVVGAPFESGSGTGVNPPADTLALTRGAAYVFARTDGQWSQQAYLKPSSPPTAFGGGFGCSVSVSGDIVVVGAKEEDGGGTGVDPSIFVPHIHNSGAAFVFSRDLGAWSSRAYVKATSPAAGDHFGSSVAASGDTVVVGAPRESEIASQSGAAYVLR